ncbi:TonB-dependent siderophore receptor [Uliginosibacterium sp. H3]|uniref:TonB-dependent siderophore receptor n=1 Tax=Uliginosibacterium silvisoli TaxID=3114758 RepID=A0ABU6K0I0_9RHOO|nr:TonB-dependent siderophore receptor [Uliginosibacterium sp. H3]
MSSKRLHPARSTLALAILAALSGGASFGAFAADAATEPAVAPVVVKAERTQTSQGYGAATANIGGKGDVPLKEIPQSVTVVTRDRMDDQNMVRLEDLARRTTGMLVLANDQGRSSIVVRGFELDSYLIDGLPAPLSSIYGTQPDLYIFDRVEVLRGPAGLYNGAGEPGGTVNLARKRALKDFGINGSLSLGSWDTRRIEADVTGSLNADGSVRGRAVAAYQQKESWVDVNQNENSVVYSTLEFDLTPRTTLSLSVTGAQSNVTPFNGLPTTATGQLLDVDRSTFIGADWNRFSNDSTEGFAELVHRLDAGGELKASARYVDRSVDFKYAYAGSATNAQGNVSRTAIAREYEEKSLAADAHWSQPFTLWGLKQNFVAGIDYRKYDQTTLSGAANPAGTTNVYTPTYNWPEPNIALTSRTYVDPHQYGVYGNLRIKPWQPLTLIAGARVSWYESTTTNLVNNTSTKVVINNQFTPYAGVVYDLTDNWSAYTSYTTIFQPQTSLTQSGQTIDPREGNNIEAGVKGEHFGGLLNSQVSVYRLRDKNRAVAVPSTAYFVANGEAEVKGAEAELSGRLLPGWEASIGYAYTQTEYISGSAGQAGTAYSTYTPRNSVNLFTRYDFLNGPLQGAYVGGGVRGMSSFYTLSGAVRIEQESYSVVDALVGYKFSPKVDLSLTINNLLDKKYYQRVGGTTVFNFYGEPRSLWLKTAVKF